MTRASVVETFLILVQSSIFRYTSRMQPYKLFDHTADIGVEISGRTMKELFVNAARALFEILLATGVNRDDVRHGKRDGGKILEAQGSDAADLLINFLRELLYGFNGEGYVLMNCEILACSAKRLKAKLWVEPYNQRKHAIRTEIKAVTYSGVSVTRNKTGWTARVIFDV